MFGIGVQEIVILAVIGLVVILGAVGLAILIWLVTRTPRKGPTDN
jgi:hypothetical protein